jgi:ATP-binding cassette, subfamily B, bacterial MsbA
VLLVFLPIVAVIDSRGSARDVRSTTRRGQDKLADIQNILHETITGNRIVKAFNMEFWELLRFPPGGAQALPRQSAFGAPQALTSPLMDFIGAVAIALLLLLGRNEIGHGAMSGEFSSPSSWRCSRCTIRSARFGIYYNNFQQAAGASAAIFEFMDDQDEVVEAKHPRVLKGFREDRSRSRELPVMASVRPKARPSCCTTSTSPSPRGSRRARRPQRGGEVDAGESDPALLRRTAGRILIDGIDVRQVSLSSLRAQIGKVTQETILFNDTVRNNIAYGQPDVPLKARGGCGPKAALAHDFIEALPDGYDDRDRREGFGFPAASGSAWRSPGPSLKNAPVLILDEATSALDAESRIAGPGGAGQSDEGRTVFVIAHRLSTVRRADRIVVIENGAIADIGSHEDLMTKLGTYRRLYELQFTVGT